MFARSFLAGLAFAVATVAQTQRLAFTTFPTLEGVTAGQPFTLRWEGGDGTPVTITLREGDATNLNTIAVITGDATGNSFDWTPSTSLPSADDYALEISQGTSDPNYSGEFPIKGGVSTTTLSSASSVLSTITIAQSTKTSTLTTTFSSSVANATVTLSGSVTLSGTGSAGTGGPSVSRNTTFSSPTLSTTTVVSAGAPSTTVEATTTASESSTGTAGAAASSSSASGAGIVQTSFGLALAGVVGIAFVFFC